MNKKWRKNILYLFVIVFFISGCYISYVYLKDPQVYFFAFRKGENVILEYDHDFSSNSFYSLKVEYIDNNLKKTISIIDKPVSGKHFFVIRNFDKDARHINAIYSLQYDRFVPCIIKGKEIVLVQ